MLRQLTILASAAATTMFALTVAGSANEPYLPRTERSFTSLDADKDGKVTAAELRPKAVKRVLRLDADKDGEISAAEIDAWLAKIMERRKARILSHLDTDKNGVVTETEIAAYAGGLVDAADADRDGAVTLAEVRGSLAKRGKQIQGSQGN